MMARLYTGCHDIISIRNGYHGNGAATMSATAQFFHKYNVVQVPFSKLNGGFSNDKYFCWDHLLSFSLKRSYLLLYLLLPLC